MKIFETEADLALASLNAGQIVKTKGSAAAFDGNENEWEISTSDGASSIALANGNFALPLTSAKSGRKNLIINGGFDIWQRGTSFPSANAQYTADRWKIGSGTQTVTRIDSTVDGYPYALRTEIVSGTQCQIRQYIETLKDNEYAPIKQGETYTVSFWARSDTSTGQPRVFFTSWDGASSPPIVDATSDLSLSTNWQRFDVQITPTGALAANNVAIGLTIELVSSGSIGDTADITGVQLEQGSFATPFEYRPIGEELALCQRYYFRTGDIYSTAVGDIGNYDAIRARPDEAATLCIVDCRFPVSMRASPTVRFWSPATGNFGFWTSNSTGDVPVVVEGVGIGGVSGIATVTAAAQTLRCHFEVDAEL